jgi:hypothetical protein
MDGGGITRYTPLMAPPKKKPPIKTSPIRVTSTGGATRKQPKNRNTQLSRM